MLYLCTRKKIRRGASERVRGCKRLKRCGTAQEWKTREDMAKFQVTRKDLARNYGKVLAVGYCSATNLLRYSHAVGYGCGVYGWNFDLYEVGGVAISTGYRPTGKAVKYDLLREYEAKAERIATRKGWKTETKARKVAELLREFVALC